MAGNALNMACKAAASVTRKRPAMTDIMAGGWFEVEHYRVNPETGIKELIGTYEAKNGVVDVGANELLDIMFHGDTQITTWYIGLIDNSPSPTLANADTLASHAGWDEFTDYTGNRQEWAEGAAAARVMTNATPATFPITATGEVRGMFLASVNTGTAGVLFATAFFPAAVPVANTDELKVTYNVQA